MMVIPFCFYVFAKDCPKGNFRELIANGQMHSTKGGCIPQQPKTSEQLGCMLLHL